jgi:hypothetical protein
MSGVYKRMNIAKEVKRCSGVKIFTDVGWIPINHVIKTIPFRKYIVLFESGNEIECAGEHCFINVNHREILAKNLTSGDKIISEYGYDIIFDVLETDEVIEMYDVSLPYHNLYYANGVLSHNSATLANIISRQVLNGYNAVLMSLEMAEQAFASRFDAIFSKLDINKMYRPDNRQRLIRSLSEVKRSDRGEIFIKQFPTGDASSNDFRVYLRDLEMRGIIIDIIYVDYINLMKPEYKTKSDMYSDVKRIAEELRSLSYEFKAPVISVSQLNREGSSLDLKDIDIVHISESMGVPATADFVMFYGSDEENIVYESELFYKIVKNRLGGRVGEIGKFYYDTRSLKLYDSVEFDMWKDDSETSGDSREISQQLDTTQRIQRRGRGERR